LTCHSDVGSQFTSARYGERLAEIGAVPSIGTIGDSFHNALAETVNGYNNAELIHGPACSGAVEDRRGRRSGDPGADFLAKHQPPTQHIADVPPTEFEASFYDAPRTGETPVGFNNPSLQTQAPTYRRTISAMS